MFNKDLCFVWRCMCISKVSKSFNHDNVVRGVKGQGVRTAQKSKVAKKRVGELEVIN